MGSFDNKSKGELKNRPRWKKFVLDSGERVSTELVREWYFQKQLFITTTVI
jgi:hypothetical protein